MVPPLLVSGALLGIFTAAMLNQVTNRIANRTIDIATEEVTRAMVRMRGQAAGDPEARWLINAIDRLDLEFRVRKAKLLIDRSCEMCDVLVKTCCCDLRVRIARIERILRDIRVELDEHKQRWMHEWLFSGVRPMVDSLREELDALDKKMDFLINLKVASTLMDANKTKALPAPEQKDPVSTDSEPVECDAVCQNITTFKQRAAQA